MPNWCTVHMQVSAPPGEFELIETFKEFVSGDNGPIDFDEIIPMPASINRGNLTFEDMKHDKNNWYDWSVKNWGTKWNACYIDVTCDEPEYGEVHYQFETAWDYPAPIIRELRRKFPTLEIGGGGYIEGFEKFFDLDDPQFQPDWQGDLFEEKDEVA